MKRLLALCLLLALLLSACAQSGQRHLERMDDEQAQALTWKVAFGEPLAEGVSRFAFRYHWNGKPQAIFYWLEVYENGARTDRIELAEIAAPGETGGQGSAAGDYTGALLLDAFMGDETWWEIGLFDQNNERTGTKKTQLEQSGFDTVVPLMPERPLTLLYGQDTVVMALLYGHGNESELQKITGKELQKDTQALAGVKLAAVLKCNFT